MRYLIASNSVVIPPVPEREGLATRPNSVTRAFPLLAETVTVPG
jgi:hypothetical protein